MELKLNFDMPYFCVRQCDGEPCYSPRFLIVDQVKIQSPACSMDGGKIWKRTVQSVLTGERFNVDQDLIFMYEEDARNVLFEIARSLMAQQVEAMLKECK